MSNFKVIQDIPDKARIKVFGSQDVALSTDSSGNLGITSTGLSITAPANGLTVTAPASGLSITPPTGGLAITSTGLAVTAPANGLTVTAPASGLSITPPTGGLLITSSGLPVVNTISLTDVSTTRANITDTGGTPDTTYTTMGLTTWSFAVVNNSLSGGQATAKLQISPDATNWIDETSVVTISQGSAAAFVPAVFLKYSRIYYAAVSGASAVTLNIFFQGQR